MGYRLIAFWSLWINDLFCCWYHFERIKMKNFPSSFNHHTMGRIMGKLTFIENFNSLLSLLNQHYLILSVFFVYFVNCWFYLGGENDDGCCVNICNLLAAISYIFHNNGTLSANNIIILYSGNLLSHLLAGNEQFNVQSNHLLLDEFKVSYCQFINTWLIQCINLYIQTHICRSIQLFRHIIIYWTLIVLLWFYTLAIITFFPIKILYQ